MCHEKLDGIYGKRQNWGLYENRHPEGLKREKRQHEGLYGQGQPEGLNGKKTA